MELVRELVKNGFTIWGKIKEDFKENKDAEPFLKRSYLVVMIDTNQLEVDRAINLDKVSDKKLVDMTPEERTSEENRKKLLAYFKKEARVVTIEVRFPFVKIEVIQEVKNHHLIKSLCSPSPASIRVVLLRHEIRRDDKVRNQ